MNATNQLNTSTVEEFDTSGLTSVLLLLVCAGSIAAVVQLAQKFSRRSARPKTKQKEPKRIKLRGHITMLHMDVRSNNTKLNFKSSRNSKKEKSEGADDSAGPFKPFRDSSMKDDHERLIPAAEDQSRNMRKRSSAGDLPDV